MRAQTIPSASVGYRSFGFARLDRRREFPDTGELRTEEVVKDAAQVFRDPRDQLVERRKLFPDHRRGRTARLRDRLLAAASRL